MLSVFTLVLMSVLILTLLLVGVGLYFRPTFHTYLQTTITRTAMFVAMTTPIIGITIYPVIQEFTDTWVYLIALYLTLLTLGVHAH